MTDRVTISDVRKAGYCTRGARRWFETHGLDFRTFLKEGVDEKTFLATGCPMAERIVRLKKERADG